MSPRPSLQDPRTAREAARELVRIDPRFAEIVAKAGPPRLPRRTPGGAFGFLVRTVVFQQLAIGAASTIHRRLLAVAGDGRRVEARDLIAAGEAGLKQAGISRPKQRTLLAMAEAARQGSFRPRSLARHDDEEVRRRITSQHGLGPWSAEIFLLFHLGRTDIFPSGDLGLLRGAARLHGQPASRWNPKRLERAARRWSPQRSCAAWYLWALLKEGRPPALA